MSPRTPTQRSPHSAPDTRPATPTGRRGGYTLMEMVSVITIMSIVGSLASFVVIQSMQVYAFAVPSMEASYQARLASRRMVEDVRELGDPASISTLTSTAFTFDDAATNTVSYALSGTDLLRNGDRIARSVSGLTFEYWKSDGTVASAAADVHLVGIDLTVTSGGHPYRVRTAAFPRRLEP